MYSIVYIDKQIIVMPSEYVQPTYKVMAFGIANKQKAYEILDRIKDKQNKGI